MSCPNHRDAPAEAACAACHQDFCANCVVSLDGQPFCAACKEEKIRAMKSGIAAEDATGAAAISTPPPEPAGFGIRFGARCLDIGAGMALGAVGGAIGGIIVAVLARRGLVSAGWQRDAGKLSAVTIAFSIVASILYHSLAEATGGATVGKALLGLRVKREGTFAPCGIAAGLGRSAAYYIDALFFGLVAYQAMAKSKLEQRLGDRWNRTVVVRAATLPARARAGVGAGLGLGCGAAIIGSAAGIIVKAL